MQSKVILTVSGVLILVPAILFFLLEFTELPLPQRILASIFQSVTTRTAGMYTVDLASMSQSGQFLMILLMLIGGSPVGTAGSMKTVTIAVLVCSAFATIRNKSSASLFGRRISEESVKKAVAVAVTFLTICATSTVLLMATNNVSTLDAVYETVSATATVGLSRNLTATLNTFGKLIIIVTMYFGRIGPISLAVALGSKNQSQNVICEPMEDISIG
jgi:trk system potassium uptake protein TrkH